MLLTNLIVEALPISTISADILSNRHDFSRDKNVCQQWIDLGVNLMVV
jgi:hypothetical protein